MSELEICERASLALAKLSQRGQVENAAHEGMLRTVLTWLLAEDAPLTPERWVNIAFISSAFVLFCSPSGALPLQRDLAAKFVGLIFFVDDGDDATLHEHVRYLETLAGGDAWSGALPVSARLFEHIRAEIVRIGSSPALFSACWLRTCRAMQVERLGDWKTGTLEQVFAIRRDSVVAHAYIQLWYAMNGVVPDDRESEVTRRLRDLSVDQILICNDLGSVDKDAQKGNEEPNYVLRLRDEEKLSSLDEAAARVVDRYNQQVIEMESESRNVLAALPPERARLLVDLAVMSVNGNLDATRYLVRFRYSDYRLTQLTYVRA